MAVGPSAAPMMPIDGCVLNWEAQKRRKAEREENAELRRRAEDHELRVVQQRLKIDHRADADEQQEREQLVRDPRVKEHVQ